MRDLEVGDNVLATKDDGQLFFDDVAFFGHRMAGKCIRSNLPRIAHGCSAFSQGIDRLGRVGRYLQGLKRCPIAKLSCMSKL
jgi:hypothetical protein